ncbi:hypothetical protein AcV5_001904 [Taiwanofungus camphoratus]|nr:hypothetical protein AcV5_001904 [Antrodia cinnamomea]
MTSKYDGRWTLLAAALLLFSCLPTAHAYCYVDGFGYEHCSLSTGARIAIGVCIAIAGLLLILAAGMIRQRRIRRANMVYINNANQDNVPPTYPSQGSPYVGAGYLPNTNPGYLPSYNAQYPQYPPQMHNGWDPQSGYAPPFQPPRYSPPQGPLPAAIKEST